MSSRNEESVAATYGSVVKKSKYLRCTEQDMSNFSIPMLC